MEQKNQKMKKVVYFGNKTSGFQNVKSTLETLEPLLAEIVEIETYSHKKNKLLRLLHMLRGFIFKGLSADFIIIDVYSTTAIIYAEMLGFMSWIFRKNYILVLHGGNLPEVYSKDKKRIKWMLNHAKNIIVPSHYLKNYFEGKGYTVKLIPNIIQLENYPFLKRCKIRPKILALRGFKPAYNPMMTVKTVEILRSRGIFVELRLLGNSAEDHYAEVLGYIEDNKLQDHIIVLPKQEKSVWIDESKGFDIMVSNPVIDNTPVSIIEGMALGMCVITTNVGGVPDLVHDYQEVLYVETDDSIGLANKIVELLSDEKLALGLSSRARIKAEQFDWRHIKALWQEILYDIASN